LPVSAGIVISTFYLWFFWCFLMPEWGLILLELKWMIKNKTCISPKIWILRIIETIKKKPFLFFSGLIILFICNFVAMFFGYGICVGDQPFSVTSAISRSFMKNLCTQTPCHVYLTYPNNETATSIFINFQTPYFLNSNEIPMVYYDTVSHFNESFSSYKYNMTGISNKYSNQFIQRGIQTILLTNLLPNTTYYFITGYSTSLSKYSQEKKFRTGPLNGPFTFVTGGDMGITSMSIKMLKYSAAQNPLFVMIGGDISYDDGMPSCYRIWDQWLINWENYMYTSDGHYIPMLLSIGNHEAGGFGFSPKQVELYLTWFPQQITPPGRQQLTYHSHIFSNNTLILNLDSYIASPPYGAQLNWIEQQFMEAKLKGYSHVFACYHAPLFPSFRPFNSYPSEILRNTWQPIFDKYKLDIAFENHDHTYKRSYLLIGNNVL
jgi:hypothetical protein